MSKFKSKKVIALLVIFVLAFLISGIFFFFKFDRYKGLIKVNKTSSSLLGDVLSSSNKINGTSEVSYEVKFTLDEIENVDTRNAVIRGTLNSRYARFKRITGENITSTVSNDGKEIEVVMTNVTLGEEQTINLIINVVNAPNNEEITPVIEVKEETGEYKRVNTDTIVVETNSIEGTVYDENNLEVSNIELSINKDGNEIKRTYTDSNGSFIFSDLEEGNYTVKVEEDIYELINDSTTSESNTNLILMVKEVDKFNIETHKYINNLKLIIDGKENNYFYKEAEKVVQNIKSFKNISGEIDYRIVVKNNSDKETLIKNVVDDLKEGLSFDESKNPGWVKVDDKIKFIPIEDVILEPYEKREIRIVLDIKESKVLKTYINELTTKGEVNNRVVFILDGEEIRNINVLEGEKITKPSLEKDVIWYTDRNKTNAYNFDNPVTKNLILYASIVEQKYTVSFEDNGMIIKTEEVKEGEKVNRPSDPTRDGYTFKCWTYNNTCFDFNLSIERDITLVSSYTINKYEISYDGLTEDEEDTLNNPTEYNVETESFTLTNPPKRKDEKGNNKEDFLGWDDGKGNVSLEVIISKGSTGDRTYTATWKENEDDYAITYNLDGGDYPEGQTNPNTYKRGTNTFTLVNPNKRGYTFAGWSGTDLDELSTEVTIPKGSSGDRGYLANYSINTYTISYEGLTPEEQTSYPIDFNVLSEDITLPTPTRVGYTFTGWSGTGIEGKTMNVTIPKGSIDNRNYKANFEINKYKVTYMDGEDKFYEEEVEYNNTAKGTTDIPTKSHFIFIGWTYNNEPYDYSTLITDNITLYSSYEEVYAPSITYTPDTWTNDLVTVTVSSDHDDYILMYKVGSGNYQEYTEPFNVSSNDTIYAYSVKNNIMSSEESTVINNIDKILPIIKEASFDELTPVSATLNTKIQDEDSGLNRFKVYVDDELVFESSVYTTDLTEEKNELYTITNLEEVTNYTIKLEVIDNAGNTISNEYEIETPPKHYVVRVLNYEGEEIEKFESLREALESDNCTTSCSLQMIDDITESNTINQGQNVKIDLNGKTITSLSNNAFYNNGTLTIVDNSDLTAGKVISNDIAIVNKNVLQIGENEEELNVDKTKPVIEGNSYAIQDDGTLRFFDGRIIGNVPINGSIDDTPFLYNAKITIVGEGEKQEAKLDKLADAVARVNSVYYTDAQDAIDKTANGTTKEVDYTRPLIEQLQSNDNYRFVYDETSKTVVNNNQNISNTLAHSYIKLDLTNYTDNQMLKINAELSSCYGYGYVTITDSIDTPSYSDTNGRLIYLSGETATKDYQMMLQKGQVYYLHIGYYRTNSTSTRTDTFKINSIKLGNFDQVPLSNIGDAVIYNDGSYYFEKQEDGSYVSNNAGVNNSTAHSYFVVDLTNVEEDKYISIGAKISSQNNADYGYITINNSLSTPTNNNTDGRQFRISGEQGEQKYYIKLNKNQINVVHICYYKDSYTSSGEDKFTILSMTPASKDSSFITDEQVVPNGNYYFVKPIIMRDLSISHNYAYPSFVTKNETGNGLVFNGTSSNYKLENVLSNSSLSQESLVMNINPNNTSNQLIYMGSSNEKIGFGVYNNYLIVAVSSKAQTYQIPADFTDGTDKKIVITADGSDYNLYYNDVLQEKQSTTDGWTGGLNTYTYIGCRSTGNIFNGTIYNVKTYNRILTEEEIYGTPTNDGLILYIDGSSEFEEGEGYVNNNVGIKNSVANSYMIFDLTNVTVDYQLTANVTIKSEENNDYGYITVTETPDAPAYNSTNGRYYFGSGSSTSNVTINLMPGKINYVHFGYRKDGSVDRYGDTFTINSLSLLKEDSTVVIFSNNYNSTVVENFSNSEIIPVLNEEPDTVELIKNITLSSPLEIVETRDTILDLNGKTLTTSANDYVIKNNGSLKIIDSDFENKQNINEEYKEEQMTLFKAAKEQYLKDKAEYEEYAGLCDECEPSDEYKLDHLSDYYDLDPSEYYNYDYIGDAEEFIAPSDGIYKIELWGAQGGSSLVDGGTRDLSYSSACVVDSLGKCQGGNGAYTSGTINLNKDDLLYVYVGEKGYTGVQNGTAAGGYNGGGSGDYDHSDNEANGGGGGATDVRLINGDWNNTSSLSSRIMVAAGGGGAADAFSGIPGGALSTGKTNAKGGIFSIPTLSTQTTGYQFGIGENGIMKLYNYPIAGGGGGYYGGIAFNNGSNYDCIGVGGSSYISGHTGSVAIKSEEDISPVEGCGNDTNDITCSYHYSGKKFTNTIMKSGNDEMPTYDGTDTMIGNTDNGHAKISLLITREEMDELINSISKTYSVKTEPIFKNYIKDLDFVDSINIDDLDINSEVEFNNTVSSDVSGTISSTSYSVILNDYDALLNVDTGNIKLDKSGSFDGITNRGRLTLGENAYVNTMQSNNRGIYNTKSGDILDGKGNITTNGSTSYGILNDSINDDNIKGYKIRSVSSNSYGFYNNSLNDLTINDISTSGLGIDIYQNTNSNLTVKNSTLGSTGNESFYSNESSIESTITFDKCTILNRINNRDNSYRKIIIKDSNMTTGNKYNSVYNYKGKVELKNTNIFNKANYSGYPSLTDASSIYNRGTLTINGGNISKNNHTSNTYTGVYNTSSGFVNIIGDLSIASNYNYGLYNEGTLTIGNNEDEVSKENPLIQGSTNAIYSSSASTLNYYDGKLIGPNNKAINGVIADTPDNYDLYITNDNSNEIIILKSYTEMAMDNDYVAQIGNNKYTSIQEAINACPDNIETTINLLKNISTSKNNVIPENKNVILNQNNFVIKSHNSNSGFTNYGTFKITDINNDISYLNISFRNFIINNGILVYDKIKTKANSSDDILINNEGATLNINGGEIYSANTRVINNSGILNITGGKIYLTSYPSGVSMEMSAITNAATGEINISGGEFQLERQGEIINNSGRVEVSDATVNLKDYGTFNGTYYPDFIKNVTTSSYAKITGGNYGPTNIGGRLINNAGTADLINLESKLYKIAKNTGTLNITGGNYNFTGSMTYRIESSAGTLNIKNATIIDSGSNSPIVSVSSTGNLNVENSTITSTKNNAIRLSGTGIANIISGNYSSTNSTAVYVNGATTLNIGTQGGDVSIENPSISGSTYGLYNNVTTSIINFYDGIISGQTAIYGSISSLETGKEIILRVDDGVEYKYLGLLPIVRNKRTGVEYYSIQEAIGEATNNDTLELLREYTTNPDLATIVNDKTITLDLMGYKIQQNNTTLFNNNGTLTIKTSLSGSKIETNSGSIITNNGVLNIEDLIYHQTTTNDVFVNNEGATLNINGGEIYSANTRVINNSGTMNISGGKIYLTSYPSGVSMEMSAITNAVTGEINITGGEFQLERQGEIINNSGRVIVSDATVNMLDYSTFNGTYNPDFIKNATSSSYAKITGGNFGETNISGRLINNAGTADLINLESKLYKIATNTGTLNITGGNYNFTGSRTYRIESSGGTLNIKNATITDSGSNSPIVSVTSSGNLNVENSTITSTKNNAIRLSGTGIANIISGNYSSTNSTAVYVNGATTLNIGTQGGDVSIENPSISGSTYGLYNNVTTSTINFYDGIISGQTAIYGSISGFESGYDIIMRSEDGIEYKYLGLLPVVRNKRTTTPYYSIQEAIDEATNNDTLELLREYTTNPNLETIVNDKTITLDLMGYKIQQNNTTLFNNNGTLTIKTSLSGSKIETNSGSIITNNGVLNIEDLIYHQTTTNDVFVNNEGATLNINGGEIYSTKTRVINNSGILNITGGKIYTTSNLNNNSDCIINNTSTGELNINGGVFSLDYSGSIINNSGSVIVSDATVNMLDYSNFNGTYNGDFIKNITSSSYAKITGGNFGETNISGRLINNAGTADLINLESKLYKIAINTGTLNITGGNYNFTGSRTYRIESSGGTLNIKNATITDSGSNSPIVSVTSSGNLNVENSTITSTKNNAIRLAGTGITNIKSGTLKSDTTVAINITGSSTLNIGETGGGEPSTTNPVIYGKTYGIVNENENTKINFYDGVIKGETNSISGSIYSYEPGYKEDRNTVTDPDTGITTTDSTLTIIGDDVKVIVVDNINFLSVQTAINYAVANNISELYLYKDVNLTSDLIKPDGIDVNIHLNGYTINDGGFNIDSGIHLVNDNSNNLGASILGIKNNGKNIVIYELDDGSELLTTTTYKLYKLVDNDYEIINVNENSVGNYDIGKDQEDINIVNKRIYINNISEGSYKLSGNDGKEINFEIYSDGVSSNIRINQKVIKNRIVTAVATLILQLQTGVIRNHLILIVLITIIILLLLIAIKRNKKLLQ